MGFEILSLYMQYVVVNWFLIKHILEILFFCTNLGYTLANNPLFYQCWSMFGFRTRFFGYYQMTIIRLVFC